MNLIRNNRKEKERKKKKKKEGKKQMERKYKNFNSERIYSIYIYTYNFRVN